jgi:hypothetical protein
MGSLQLFFRFNCSVLQNLVELLVAKVAMNVLMMVIPQESKHVAVWRALLQTCVFDCCVEICVLAPKVYPSRGRHISVGIATRYGLDGQGIESRWGRDFPLPSKPALGPTQLPIHWVPGLSRG